MKLTSNEEEFMSTPEKLRASIQLDYIIKVLESQGAIFAANIALDALTGCKDTGLSYDEEYGVLLLRNLIYAMHNEDIIKSMKIENPVGVKWGRTITFTKAQEAIIGRAVFVDEGESK